MGLPEDVKRLEHGTGKTWVVITTPTVPWLPLSLRPLFFFTLILVQSRLSKSAGSSQILLGTLPAQT